MSDALCTIMIIHSTLWEAIKIVPLRIFFQVYFKVTPEKVIWSVQVGSVYLTWQSFLQNILLFYLCAYPAVTGGGGAGLCQVKKQGNWLLICTTSDQVGLGLTMPYSVFRILRSV